MVVFGGSWKMVDGIMIAQIEIALIVSIVIVINAVVQLSHFPKKIETIKQNLPVEGYAQKVDNTKRRTTEAKKRIGK